MWEGQDLTFTGMQKNGSSGFVYVTKVAGEGGDIKRGSHKAEMTMNTRTHAHHNSKAMYIEGKLRNKREQNI